MHCELIVPALMPGREFEGAAASIGALRLPALEMLLARSRRQTNEAASLEQWLAQAFDADADAEIPAGALTVAALGGDTGVSTWMRADPQNSVRAVDR